MGDTPQQDPKSYDLSKFDPDEVPTDKTSVLGTESSIDTETGQIDWETYGKTIEELTTFRDSIDPEQVRKKATDWRDHGEAMSAVAGEFANEVKSKIVDSWDSEGGSTASTAVQRYADQLATLSEVVDAVANSLDFSADFLETTQKNIPDKNGELIDGTSIVETSGDFDTTATKNLLDQMLLQRARDVMNQVFVPGGKAVDGAMPIFPLPKPVTQGLSDPTTGRPPGQQGTGSGSGSSGGSTSAGGQPPQLKQQAASDPAELQRQELDAAREDLEEQAALQQEALQQQQRQLEQQAGSQQMLQAGQQGLQQLGRMGEQLSTAAQQALQQAGITGLPGMPALQEAAKNYQSALQKAGKLPPGLGGGPGGSPSSMPAPKGGPSPNVEKAAKLFPRASLAGSATNQTTGVVAASATPGAPMGGMPMGGGGAAGGAQGAQEKTHKRADYLDSTEYIEEGIGEAPIVAKPVVDQ